LKIAEEIRDETSLQGRVRRPLVAELQESLTRRVSELTKQQQCERSSDRVRASTSRPLGGGVLSCTTALLPTATDATTTTTTTTTHHTTDVRAGPEVRAGAVDGGAVVVEGDTNGTAQGYAQSNPLCRGVSQMQGSLSRLCAAQIRTRTHKLQKRF
jgi:hypothetical protein